MAPAGILNYEVDAGTTFDDTLTVYDEDGVVFNLTGYSAIMQIRSAWVHQTNTLYATFGTATSGITIPTPANGQIVIGPIDRTALSSLSSIPVDTLLYYSLNIYVSSGVEYGITRGTFRIIPTAATVP